MRTETPTTKSCGSAEEQFDALVDYAQMAGRDLTWKEVKSMHSLGRNDFPAILSYVFDYLDQTSRGEALEAAWVGSEYPTFQLSKEEWVTMFHAFGYTVDGTSRERPTESVTLYRGATPECKHGMSWTDNLDIAARFASGDLLGRDPGFVFTAEVEPGRLYAHFHEGRGESEFVIETDGLDVVALKRGE
jgi:hypothetical protein